VIRKILTLLGQELRRPVRNFYHEATPLLLFGLLTYLGLKLGYAHFIPRIQNVDTTVWMLPNLVAFTFMLFTYLHVAEGIYGKKTSGYLSYLLTTDLSPGLLTLTFTIDGIIKGLVKSIILLLLYWLLFGAVGSVILWIWFFAVMILVGIFWASLGIISGLLINQSLVNSYLLVGVILPIVLLSGMIFPLAEYPPSLRMIVSFLPSALGFETGRAVLNIAVWSQYFLPLLFGWAIVTFIIALLLLRKERQ